MTIPHLEHCLHHARRFGFCHHTAISNSGSCCLLHQEPGKSRTGLSLSNLSASCQSKRPCQAWILLSFSVATCPFTGASNSTMSAAPSPICVSAVCHAFLIFPTKLVPIVCIFTAACSPSRLRHGTLNGRGASEESRTLRISYCMEKYFCYVYTKGSGYREPLVWRINRF